MLRCVLLSLAWATFAHAQGLPPGYDSALNTAKARGVPLVIFVGGPGRTIAGAEVMECWRFPQVANVGIVVGAPDKTGQYMRYDLSALASDDEIRRFFPAKTATQPAPFRQYQGADGTIYREYYSAPAAPKTNYPGTPDSSSVSVRPTYQPAPYYQPAPIAVYGGFQAGPIGGYAGFGGANCVGST